MLKGPFLSKDWMAATDNFSKTQWIMVGLPYDGTCSNRPGTRFAPAQIRLASWGLEEYSPLQNKMLDDVKFYDAGELDLPLGNRDKCLEMIYENTKQVLDFKKKWLGIGGEHLVTYPAIKAYCEKFPDLAVIQFDAHADMREEYLGEEFSHATVMRRISDLVGFENIFQIGIRSGMQEEFELMKAKGTLINDKTQLEKIVKHLQNRPVFITVDLDVLDPSIMGGTGTPEVGGMTFNEFFEWISLLKNLNIVGMDALELSPDYDTSGVSTTTAAKVIREMLIMFG